jgi:endonuclease IV
MIALTKKHTSNHNLGHQLGASLLTLHIGWKQKQKVKKSNFKTVEAMWKVGYKRSNSK